MRDLLLCSAVLVAILADGDSYGAEPTSGPIGKAQINIGSVDTPGAFMNFMKGYGSQSFAVGTSPSDLDVNGYPNKALAGNIGGAIAMPSRFCRRDVTWVIKWPATTILKFVVNNATSKILSANATVSGGTNSAMTISGNGSAGRVEFVFESCSGGSISFYFPGGFANSAGAGGLVLVRKLDETLYDSETAAGLTPFTREFIALLKGPASLHPKTIRPMGWINTGPANVTNQVQWRYRTRPNSLSWTNDQFPTGAWGGTVRGTDNYVVGAAPDTPATWTGGEVIQGIVTNANTIAAPTLNVNGRGAKPIVNSQGLGLSPGSIPANSLATFVYDSVLDKVLYTRGGVTGSVPLEAQVSLANQAMVNLWTVVPAWADDDYVTSWAAYVRDNLNQSLSFYPEYSNEIWNFAFPQTQWAYQRGRALGWPNANNEPLHGWYGLRTRQIMGRIKSLWTAKGRALSSLKRVMAAYAIPSAVNQAQVYRLEGRDLVGTMYPKYLDYVGGVDPGYNVPGNQPIDFCDVLAYAPYVSGANFPALDQHYTQAMASALQMAATNFAEGAKGATTALKWLDEDIRAGKVNGAVGGQTLLAHSQRGGIYLAWDAVAANYDSRRPTPISVEAYEGGLESAPPSASQCTRLGVTAPPIGGGTPTAMGCSAQLAALLSAYKNSNYGFNLTVDYFTQFIAPSHSKVPAWLTITGPNPWSLLPGDMFSTPYQTYNGFEAFSTR
jgi:hypothetical protein